jgi:leader peptidase (prepilin peptidase)/N-methyltransferase
MINLVYSFAILCLIAASFWLPYFGKMLLAYRGMPHAALRSYSIFLSIMGGIGGALLLYLQPADLELVIGLVFLFLLLLISWMDWHTYYILDQLTIGGSLLLFLLLAIEHFPGLFSHLIGSAAVYLFFYILGKGTHRLGQGDAKLLAMCALVLNWQGILFALWLASISGLVFVMFLVGKRKSLSLKDKLAFGPHLALGAFLAYLFINKCPLTFSCKTVLSTLLVHILY